MKITVNGDVAYVQTPYNANFVNQIKSVGGSKWDKGTKSWIVPADDGTLLAVRQIMQEVYGETDNDTSPKFNVRLYVSNGIDATKCDVTVMGKCLSHAWGRDSGARCGDGVSYVKGKPESGGSVKNWHSRVPANSEIVLSGVPVSIYSAEKDHLPSGVTCELISDDTFDRAALEAERERLLSRISEIDKILGL